MALPPPVVVPSPECYKKALEEISITPNQRLMLKAHFEHPNRSMTYGQLAEAGGFDSYNSANLQYGRLGRALGEALGLEFEKFTDTDVDYTSSAIGMPAPKEYWTHGQLELVMHHALARALEDLKWF
jgi:hypothetical protein